MSLFLYLKITMNYGFSNLNHTPSLIKGHKVKVENVIFWTHKIRNYVY